MTEMTEAPPTLEYGRRPANRRWWWALAAVAVFLASAGYYAIRAYTPHWTEYTSQRQQDAAVPPAGEIIYSEEPADIARLAGVAGYTTKQLPGPMIYSGPIIPRVRAVWREGVTWAGMSGGYPFWLPHYRDVTPCGRYRAVGGDERFIHFISGACAGHHDGDRDVYLPGCRVSSVVTLWPGPPMKAVGSGYGAVQLIPGDHVIVYSPFPDSKDTSHFTVGYAINGQPGVIDGWLLPSDEVVFRLTSGPATTRPVKGYVSAKP